MSNAQPALSFQDCNLWSLPHVCLTKDEFDENKKLAHILQKLSASTSDSDTTSAPPSTYYACCLTGLLLRPTEGKNKEYIQLEDIKLLVSSRTNRMLFIGIDDGVVYQKRLYHIDNVDDVKYFDKYPKLEIRISSNPFMKDSELELYLKSDKDLQQLQQVLKDALESSSRLRIITPEVLSCRGPTHFALVAQFELLQVIQNIFTDIIYGDGAQAFAIIAAGFDHRKALSSAPQMGNKVVSHLRRFGIPKIFFSQYSDSFDSEISTTLSEMERGLDTPGLVLGGDEHFYDLVGSLPDTSKPGCIWSAINGYGAHLRSDDGSIPSVLHVSMKLIQLYIAARRWYAEERHGDSKSAWLATQAMVVISIMHEIAHFLVRLMHGEMYVTPQPDKSRSWITREMLVGESEADSGFMVEVLWLGHRSDLVFDATGTLRLFVPNDLDEPAFREEWETPPVAFSFSDFWCKMSEVEDSDSEVESAPASEDLDSQPGWLVSDECVRSLLGPEPPSSEAEVDSDGEAESAPAPEDLDSQPGWLVSDECVRSLLGPKLPHSRAQILTNQCLPPIVYLTRSRGPFSKHCSPKPAQPTILSPGSVRQAEGLFSIPPDAEPVIMHRQYPRRKDVYYT